MGKMVKEEAKAAAAVAAEGDEVVPGDVACDVCTVRRLKAVKSCLVCLASYCSTHLQPHYQSAAFKRHKLVEVSVSMQDQICPKHDKLLEVFCRSDGHCICLLCVMDEHRSHDTVSAAAEREARQKQFGKKKQRYQRGIQEKENKLQKLRRKIDSLKCSGDAAVQEADRVYTEIVQTADMKLRAVKQRIRVEEKAGVSRAGALVDRLEREISELRKGEDALKQLSLTEDHIHFLQNSQPISNCPEPNESPDYNIHLDSSCDFMKKAICTLKDQMENITQGIVEITETIQADPMKREEFLLYICNLSLDPNTAFENLMLSDGNSKVTWIKRAQHRPDHRERFTKYDQVLCTEGLSAVCYWEVEWKGPRVEVAMCYKGSELQENSFGYTDQSWSVSLSTSSCSFWHNNVKTRISVPCSDTVGVYLNHEAGSLSFYSVSYYGQMRLLHRVQTTFSKPLYPGFMVSTGSSVQIRAQK